MTYAVGVLLPTGRIDKRYCANIVDLADITDDGVTVRQERLSHHSRPLQFGPNGKSALATVVRRRRSFISGIKKTTQMAV
jgi:hypothetical protein